MRRPETPSENMMRIVTILVTLLQSGSLDYTLYKDRFGLSSRTFLRDAKYLRLMGESAGYVIPQRTPGRILLVKKDSRFNWIGTCKLDSLATLVRIATALGDPVVSALREGVGEGETPFRDGFLHVRAPQPREGSRLAAVLDVLKAAANDRARVRFTYTKARSNRGVRTVEPYYVIWREGRYYLIAYDDDRGDWRQFGLDAISGQLVRAGTFRPRAVPPKLIEQSAVGWIRGGTPTEVTIRLSPVVATSVAARQWQAGERVASLPDGGMDITVAVDDLGEAIRWALRFGTEAVVVSPPEAVALARTTAESIASLYKIRAAKSSRHTVGTGA